MSELTKGPGPDLTPEGVPNIDEHPSFNGPADPLGQATATDPVIDDAGAVENTEEEGPQPAIGIHVVFMEDGQFGISATGEPNLGEMQMLLSRALKSVESRMIGETVAQVMKQTKSRIITPGQ